MPFRHAGTTPAAAKAAGALTRLTLLSPPLPVSSPGPSDPTGAAAAPVPPPQAAGQPVFGVGESVQLAQRPAYLKSADPMPMLRPPDLIDESETGLVVEVRGLEQRAVRFRRGTFLLSTSQLR